MVVVLSNFSISGCYSKATERDQDSVLPLNARFREVELTHVYREVHVGAKRSVCEALMPQVIQCRPQSERQ